MDHKNAEGASTGRTVNSPLIRESFGRPLPKIDSASRVCLQHLAARLHALGERPLLEFLAEIERGSDLRVTLEAYARLSPDFIRAHGGDRLAKPRLVATAGNRAHERPHPCDRPRYQRRCRRCARER